MIKRIGTEIFLKEYEHGNILLCSFSRISVLTEIEDVKIPKKIGFFIRKSKIGPAHVRIEEPSLSTLLLACDREGQRPRILEKKMFTWQDKLF